MNAMYQPLADILQSLGNHLTAHRPAQVGQKSSAFDFVTEQDVWVQNQLKAKLHDLLPSAYFVGEEGDSDQVPTGCLYWMVDPIDGTTNFVRNLGLSCISVALCQNNETQVAAVYCPWTKEFFFAARGEGAFCNGQSISVTSHTLPEGIAAFGQGYGDRAGTLAKNQALIEKCYLECVNIRSFGVAELTICYIAAGKLDVYFEPALMPWDHAAGNLILHEAGGVFSNWAGDIPSYTGMDSLLIGNPACHAALLPLCQAHA